MKLGRIVCSSVYIGYTWLSVHISELPVTLLRSLLYIRDDIL